MSESDRARAEATRPQGRRADGGAPGATPRDRPHALAERLAREMSADWSAGRRPTAEEVLARHPEVRAHPEAAARVIYEEFCLREALGPAPGSAEVFSRFPEWRAELRMLLDCHYLVHPRPAHSDLPAVGEVLGDYRLRALLGRGLRGCVFLATQDTLADRPVVLKVTRRRGGEHLSLARLQHPHVVPLYAVHDFPDRDLRALCMPYLGGATLDRALVRLEDVAPSSRDGRSLLAVLDEARTEWVAHPAWSSTRQFLAGATYPRAICWVAACLAEALHAAHARGLVHLDLKPSNVLLADDGQPMLLDFHLARPPLGPGSERPEHLGGTPGYWSPEQARAMAAVRDGRPVESLVDGRSDVYSLGVVLFEALAGFLPTPDALDPPAAAAALLRANRKTGAGLAAVVAHCLAADPVDRYPDAAHLALDLRRHLGNQPPVGAVRPGRLRRWLGLRG